MSVIVKIIKAEATVEKNATKRLVENWGQITNEARAIADIRAEYRGKHFAAAMKAQGFGNLGERDQRNNLAAVLWIATDEGASYFMEWAEAIKQGQDRPNCSTLRGIKKAAMPKATRAARQSEGGDEAEAVEGKPVSFAYPRTAADILKNALDQCRPAGISPEQFLEFVISAEGAKVFDKAIDKAA